MSVTNRNSGCRRHYVRYLMKGECGMLRRRLSQVASGRAALVLILLVCVMLRLGMAVHVAKRPLTGDACTYTNVARHIAAGEGFSCGSSSAFRPTAYGNAVYPYFLAAIFRVFGFSVLAVLLI